MRLARKLFLLTAMAIAAMAITAGAASAQEEPVAVIQEAVGGGACNVGTGNCDTHVVGSSVLTQHIFGSESQASACNDEFVARLGPSGAGNIHIYTNNAPTPPCTRIKCTGVGEPTTEREWPITNTGEYTTAGTVNDGHMRVRFCLDTAAMPNDPGTHCTVEIDVDEDAVNHRYLFKAVNEHCPVFPGVEAELDGTWASETTLDPGQEHIEIVHTAPIN